MSNVKLVIILVYLFRVCPNLDIRTLKVVHVIFRHGEKNPDIQFTYAGDPHKNESFYPFSQGQLNLAGRQTMYSLGHVLRKRYHRFLDEIYSPKIIEAWSSPYFRNIFSLQIVMAALFPPSEVERWNDKLNWQPTLYHFSNFNDDKLFSVFATKEYGNYYWKVCRTDKYMQSVIDKYKPWLKYIEDHTSFSGDCPRSALFLYQVLIAENEAHLKLPDWSKPIFPKVLKELAAVEMQLQIHTRRLKRMVIGNLLYKILNNTQNHVFGLSEKKFFLYAAHEVNIIHILSILGFMYPHIPSYGAYLAMEIHEIKDRYVLKIFYKDSKHTQVKLLKNILGDDHMTLEEYKRIVDDIFTNDDDENIKSSTQKTCNVIFWFTFLFLPFLLME